MKTITVDHTSTKIAEVELRYKTMVNPKERAQIKSSRDAFELLYAGWNKNTIEYLEEFKVVLLNRSNRVLGIATLSCGSTVSCIVDVKVLLQYAIKTNASAIIVAHNHPSGNLEPSDADKNITNKILKAGNLIDIKLLDHLVIAPHEAYLSFADEGIWNNPN